MADESTEVEEGAGGGKKKLIIIIVAVVLLLAGGGGAAFFMMSGDEPVEQELIDGESNTATSENTEEANDDSGEAEVGDAFYVRMPRPFIFNVPGYGRDRLVQIKVQLLVRGAENDTSARKHIPLIEDTLLTVFSNSNAEKLATRIGKDELRTLAQEAVQKALEPIVGQPVIEKVLFIGFVMQ